MDQLREYRDDGPVAWLAGRAKRVHPLLVLLLGSLPLGIALAVDAGGPAVSVSVGWFVLLASLGSLQPVRGRLAWLTPITLRATEYGFVVAFTALRVESALPAAYALLFAISIHQYETVYRIRHLGVAPPRWVGWVAGGWEGRMMGVTILELAGILAEGMFVWAAWAAIVTITESASVWIKRARAEKAGAA